VTDPVKGKVKGPTDQQILEGLVRMRAYVIEHGMQDGGLPTTKRWERQRNSPEAKARRADPLMHVGLMLPRSHKAVIVEIARELDVSMNEVIRLILERFLTRGA
jgi:hypothetical protein